MNSISMFLGCTLIYSLFFVMAHGATLYYEFVLKEANFTRLCETKSIITVNGTFPGPTIRANKGDTIFVTVHNHGNYGVTIHWHGVKLPRNPWSDGPENITQCPIQPGKKFTQEINLSTEEGTLWWHAHSDWTRATVHGAIVIHPKPGSTYPFEMPYAEKTLVLGEWYKGDVMQIIKTALATGSDPNVSDAFTINGQPGDLYSCSNGSTTRIKVAHGKTYLFRIISAIMNEEMFFGIANHSLTVVGQDAAYVKPITVDWILITPGQTMDVLVTMNKAHSMYYISASPFSDSFVPFDNTVTTAILRYGGHYTAPKSIPSPSFPANNNATAVAKFWGKIRALASKKHPISVPKHVTKRIYMTVSVNSLACNGTCTSSTGDRISASLNNVSFKTPSVDILEAYYYNLSGVFTSDFPSNPPSYYNFSGNVTNVSVFTKQGTRVIPIDYGEHVEIVFQGTNLIAAENHPMHLHGYSFYVVGRNFGNFNNVTDPLMFNLVDPPEVNTVAVPTDGWVAIRFAAKNPGVWFMHCHLERHASWGMETAILVKNGKLKHQSIRPPPPHRPSCTST